jgi:hypothetical protein
MSSQDCRIRTSARSLAALLLACSRNFAGLAWAAIIRSFASSFTFGSSARLIAMISDGVKSLRYDRRVHFGGLATDLTSAANPYIAAGVNFHHGPTP